MLRYRKIYRLSVTCTAPGAARVALPPLFLAIFVTDGDPAADVYYMRGSLTSNIPLQDVFQSRFYIKAHRLPVPRNSPA